MLIDYVPIQVACGRQHTAVLAVRLEDYHAILQQKEEKDSKQQRKQKSNLVWSKEYIEQLFANSKVGPVSLICQRISAMERVERDGT